MSVDPEIFRDALESTPVGLYLVDRDRKITLWSDGAERITGYMRQEVIGHPCQENLLDHCDITGTRTCETACPLTCAIQNGRASERVLYLKHKHGHRVPVRVYAVGLRNARGGVVGAMELFHEQTVIVKPMHTTSGTEVQPAESRALTLIPSRPLTLAVLRDAIAACRSQMIGCGVICIQIAQFQKLKATHTQSAGQQMLEAVAASVRQMLRQSDQVGRWSEDQLLVILPGCHPSALEIVGKRLCGVAHQTRIRWWGDELSAPLCVGGVMAREDEPAGSVAARAVSTTAECAERNQPEDVVFIQS